MWLYIPPETIATARDRLGLMQTFSRGVAPSTGSNAQPTRRAVHTAVAVFGSGENVLRQTVIGMIEGTCLAEHENLQRGCYAGVARPVRAGPCQRACSDSSAEAENLRGQREPGTLRVRRRRN